MTSTLEMSGAVDVEIFKRDKVGRVWVSRARREALINEFERGGTSGAQFADYVGIKYSTFANWLQKRKRQQASGVGIDSQNRALKSKRTAPMRWLETMVDAEGKESDTEARLRVHLPGGAYLEIANRPQADRSTARLPHHKRNSFSVSIIILRGLILCIRWLWPKKSTYRHSWALGKRGINAVASRIASTS
jgi:hypothetical protein